MLHDGIFEKYISEYMYFKYIPRRYPKEAKIRKIRRRLVIGRDVRTTQCDWFKGATWPVVWLLNEADYSCCDLVARNTICSKSFHCNFHVSIQVSTIFPASQTTWPLTAPDEECFLRWRQRSRLFYTHWTLKLLERGQALRFIRNY